MRRALWLTVLAVSMISRSASAQAPSVSEHGQACLDCHSSSTPGIVKQWRERSHAKSRRGLLFLPSGQRQRSGNL